MKKEKGRYGCSFGQNEIQAMQVVFNTLYRGGDVSALLRSKDALHVVAKFAKMSERVRRDGPTALPLDERVRRMNAGRKKARALDDLLPKAEGLRSLPYMFSEQERWTILGLTGVFPVTRLARYYGLPPTTLRELIREWRTEAESQVAEQAADAAE